MKFDSDPDYDKLEKHLREALNPYKSKKHTYDQVKMTPKEMLAAPKMESSTKL